MTCKTCGSPVSKDDLFCGVCGARIEYVPGVDDEEETAPAEESEGSFDPSSPFGTDGDPDGDGAFDPSSPFGTDTGAAAAPASKPKSGSTKTLGIALGIGAAVIVAIIVLIVLVSKNSAAKQQEPILIDLNNYVSESVYVDADVESLFKDYSEDGDYYEDYDDEEEYEEGDSLDDTVYAVPFTNDAKGAGLIVTGYNSAATVESTSLMNVLDWGALEADINAALNEKKNRDRDSFSSLFAESDFTVTADKTADLKNGDTVTVTFSAGINGEVSKNGFNFKFTGGTKQYTVNDLPVVHGINPFDYIEVHNVGANGNGSTYWTVSNKLNESIEGVDGVKVTYSNSGENGSIGVSENGQIYVKIEFELDEAGEETNHSNGDSFVMNCYVTDNEGLLKKYNLYILQESKTYTVNGLGDYIIHDYKFSDDDLEKFTADAKARYKDDYGSNDSCKNFKLLNAYISSPRNMVDGNYNFNNEVIFVFTYKYQYWSDSDPETKYYYVVYSNVISRDGKVMGGPEDYYDNRWSDDDSFDVEYDQEYKDDYTITKIS